MEDPFDFDSETMSSQLVESQGASRPGAALAQSAAGERAKHTEQLPSATGVAFAPDGEDGRDGCAEDIYVTVIATVANLVTLTCVEWNGAAMLSSHAPARV